MLAYPKMLPVDALQIIIAELKGTSQPMASLLQAAWNLQGYAQGQILTTTSTVPVPAFMTRQLAVPHFEAAIAGGNVRWDSLLPVLLDIIVKLSPVLSGVTTGS